jgi:hypothetical protein
MGKGFLFLWIIAVPAFLLMSTPEVSFAKSSKMIRNVSTTPEQVTVVHTAMGYSTILEFSGKPLNAVLGDQDAFKVEFVGNSLTIKPILPRARSNLFVFTEFERVNCQLESGSPSDVDYIVSFKPKEKAPDEVATGGARTFTQAIHRFKSIQGFRLTVDSIERSKSEIPGRSTKLIEIELSSSTDSYSFSPSSLGVKQAGHFLPIESIYLDALSLKPGASPTHGKIAILDQDLTGSGPLSVVFAVSNSRRSSKAIRLEVVVEPLKKASTKSKTGGDPLYGTLPTSKKAH